MARFSLLVTSRVFLLGSWLILTTLFFLALQRSHLWADLLHYGHPATVYAQTPPASSDWYMAGANPQRTSWVASDSTNQTEIKGQLYPQWYKTIGPYIPSRVQLIITNDTIYISTARGLYTYDLSGNQKWVFPTEMPLGNSPTVIETTVYVGCFDHHLYALKDNGSSYTLLWSYEATQGFDTNPVVVGNTIYLGNRDGAMYAITDNGTSGSLAWKYQTNGTIDFSAAYKNNTLYFASNDSYVYALNATTGALIWKSAKLPGEGFHTWWPVVYTDTNSGKDYVILGGSFLYRAGVFPRPSWNDLIDLDFYDTLQGITDVNRGDTSWQQYRGDLTYQQTSPGWLDTNAPSQIGSITSVPILNYYQQKPWRRTYFILNATDGTETVTAPLLWFGTHSGNRYPPIVGGDNNLYQPMWYMFDQWIPAGQVTGWKFGTSQISLETGNWNARDEPEAYSGGGKMIYWDRLGDRAGGGFDISKTDTTFPNWDSTREWLYFNYDLSVKTPNYMQGYVDWTTSDHGGNDGDAVYGNGNGIYGIHGNALAPIPYKGRVYFLKFNAIIAFSPTGGTAKQLPSDSTIVPPNANITLPTFTDLQAKLADQVAKILTAGHLRPGYTHTGTMDNTFKQTCGSFMYDLWHEPSDTIDTLVAALPYLPTDPNSSASQDKVKTYLQNEFTNYPPDKYTHIGWATGASRDAFILPPEDQAALSSVPAQVVYNGQFPGWHNFPPRIFYTEWKYALAMNYSQSQAKALFDQSSSLLEATPSATILQNIPFVHNAWIAGLMGYLNLQQMAGYPQDPTVQTELNNLLALKASFWSQGLLKDTRYAPYYPSPGNYFGDVFCRTFSVSRNFIFLTPELGTYLNSNPAALAKVQEAVNEYNTVAPFWFTSQMDATLNEGVFQPLYDVNAMMLAKAYVLKQPYSELVKYLDVPGYAVGDLFYIQNLVAALSAANGTLTPTPALTGDLNGDGKIDGSDLLILLQNYLTNNTQADLNHDGVVNMIDGGILIGNIGK
jgi:outer membrane protein assembly factor BamB